MIASFWCARKQTQPQTSRFSSIKFLQIFLLAENGDVIDRFNREILTLKESVRTSAIEKTTRNLFTKSLFLPENIVLVCFW